MATNFPNGVASYGLPVFGGLYGLPGQGLVWFVDPVNGNDGNSGKSNTQAFQTLTKGYAQLRNDKNDVLVLLGSASAGATLSATLTWAKNQAHLIGVSSPTFMNQRARISFSANFTPGISITGSGCLFQNIYIPYGRGNAGNLTGVQVTGARNVFINCHFLIGDATEAGTSGFVLVDLAGAQECLFQHCTFGNTTVVSSAANKLVSINNSAGRLLFEDCTFLREIQAVTTPVMVHVTNATNALQEFAIFRRSSFLTYSINQAAKLAQAVVGGPAAGGVIMLDDCGFTGFTKVTVTNPTQVWIISREGNTAGTQGLSVNPA